METTTARVTRPGEKPKYIVGAINYQDYLCALVMKGVGKPHEAGGFNAYGEGEVWEEYDQYKDFYKPYFNNTIVEEYWGKEVFKGKYGHLEVQQIIGTEAEKALIRWGENEDGMLVEDMEDVKRAKQAIQYEEIRRGKLAVDFYPGYAGLRIGQRLPPDLWSMVRPYVQYIRGDEADLEDADDMGYGGVTREEIRGWVYGPESIDILIGKGVRVTYRGFPVTSSMDILKVNERMRVESEEFARKRDKVLNKAKGYKAALSALYTGGTYISEEEAARVGKLPEIHLLNWRGANIYGGGSWLHTDGEDLYLVVNNGMDGDNWSRNNYGTGGAGAICVKASGAACIVRGIQEWIDSLGEDIEFLSYI